MKCAGRLVYAVLCSVNLGLLPAPASEAAAQAIPATSTIGNLSSWTYGYAITGFGDQGDPPSAPTLFAASTVGQTFRVTGGTVRVTRMEAPIFDRSPAYSPHPSDYQIGVAAWNGVRPVGPLLYLSDHRVAYDSTWRNAVVTPDNLILDEGQDYVLFFPPINYLDGLSSYADVGYIPYDSYADGHFVSLVISTGDPTIGTAALFDQDWRTLDPAYAQRDMVFEISYETIPEPGTATLMGLGLIALWHARRQSQATRAPAGTNYP